MTWKRCSTTFCSVGFLRKGRTRASSGELIPHKKIDAELFYTEAFLHNIGLRINIPRPARLTEPRIRQIVEGFKKSLSIASHELKTPLTTIKAFTQLALAEGEDLQLLDISKVESGQLDFAMEEISMNGYIHDTAKLRPENERPVNDRKTMAFVLPAA